MRLGFSVLLGELIAAVDVAYDDCRSFQIVCPACREPVFKVARHGEPATIDYLSHYAADAAYGKDCELRVANIGHREIEVQNAAARGQSLRLFLSVLKDAIITTEYDDANRPAAARLASRFAESRGFREFREMLFEHSHEIFRRLPLADADEFLQDYVDDVLKVGAEFPRTTFALSTQKRIAWDVWTHLLSPAARGNFHFLLTHAVVHFLTRIEAAERERTLFEFEKILAFSLTKLMDSTRPIGQIVLRQLAETPIDAPHSLGPSDLFTKLGAELTHEQLGILLRLPYFELLQAAQSERDLKTPS